MYFLRWFTEQRKLCPEMGISEGKRLFNEIRLTNLLTWMKELGWSEDIVRTLPPGKVSFLGDPEYLESLRTNTELMLQYMERDNVLTLLLEYGVTFAMDSAIFLRYVSDIVEYVGDGWQYAIMRQYQEDHEHMILRSMPIMPLCQQARWENELERLYYCSQRLFYVDTCAECEKIRK